MAPCPDDQLTATLSLFPLSLSKYVFLNTFYCCNSFDRLPIFLPTPRVHHVARPSFISFSVSCHTLLVLLHKEQYPLTCIKRGNNNYHESFSVSTPQLLVPASYLIHLHPHYHLLGFSKWSDARSTQLPESVRSSTVSSRTSPHPSESLPALPPVGDFRTSLILPECVFNSFLAYTCTYP